MSGSRSWRSRSPADFSWAARIADLERKAREAEDREHVDRIRGHRARLRQEGLLLQQKGLEWIKGKDADAVRVGEAIRAIGEGFRLEALGLGEATERIAIEDRYRGLLEGLTDDELARLVALLHTAPGASAAGDGAAPAG